jgi:hypothetical protein
VFAAISPGIVLHSFSARFTLVLPCEVIVLKVEVIVLKFGVIVSHLWGVNVQAVWADGKAAAGQFVGTLIAAARPIDQHIFQFDQTGQVTPQLEVAPAQGLAQLALGEADR